MGFAKQSIMLTNSEATDKTFDAGQPRLVSLPSRKFAWLPGVGKERQNERRIDMIDKLTAYLKYP